MKIKYLVFSQKSFETLDENLKSLKINKKDIEKCLYSDIDDLVLKINENIEKINGKEYSHVILLNGTDILTDNSIKLFENYSKDKENVLFMPIIHVKDYDSEGNVLPKGFFNRCLWEGQLNEFYFIGEFSHNLSLKQIDLSIFSCLIPLSLLKKEKFDSSSKYYFGNEWLNRISKKIDDAFEGDEYYQYDILGIPKILSETFFSSEFKILTKEEKIKYFNLAKESFSNTEENLSINK